MRRAEALAGWRAVYAREAAAYAASGATYVFLAAFLLVLGLFTWEIGGFLEGGRADLSSFFAWHPWLYVLFLAALSMRLWADERTAGTDELLFSLPLGVAGMVVGKFLATWSVLGVALLLTLPMWIAVNFLGEPDNGVIALSYAVSFLMAGAYTAIGAAMSAAAPNQVTAFVLAVAAGFAFTAAGWPLVLASVSDLLGVGAASLAAQMSFLTHYERALSGVLALTTIAYFALSITFWLYLNALWAGRRTGR